MAKQITDSVVRDFSRAVREKAGAKLREIVLFGSRARGDHSEHSDYDFLIILDSEDSQLKEEIRDLEVEMMDTYGVLVSALVFSDSAWEKRLTMPLGLNVRKEGIAV
ncbi:MAG: nucleotidyltransferase domain-containing protein [Spirochaetia bacterium]|nr:nucleotidyltransferase domain-containing protein [Spirochaetia bacterium]